MYFSLYDQDQAILLGVTSGSVTDQEYQQMCDDINRLTDDSFRAHKDLIIIMLPQPDTERPNATQRRKLGDLRSRSNAPYRSFSVMVTPSLLLRGILTALHWIMPARSNEKTVAFNSFGEAHAWLVKETKKPLHALVRMHQEAIQKLSNKISA